MKSNSKNNSKNKNKKAKKSTAKKCLILAILIFCWWFNNYSLHINSTSISSDKLTAPARLAVLSDYHAHALSISKKTILETLEKITPDAVIVLGDMYTSGSTSEGVDMAISLMSAIAEKYTVYFVSGEHDASSDYIASLSQNGVRVMNYADETVNINGNSIRFLGIDNAYYSPTFNLKNEFTLYDGNYNILLAHIPNYEKFADFGADLTLCGDTHGGMFRLPVVGPVYDSQSNTFFPKLQSSGTPFYDKGFYDYKGGTMFITSGIGDSPTPIRFCNLPEIVSIDLLPSEVNDEN